MLPEHQTHTASGSGDDHHPQLTFPFRLRGRVGGDLLGGEMSEKFYDEEIAPVLLELSKKCEARGVSFIAVAEYAAGHRGRTSTMSPNAGLEMRMLDFCARAGANVDGYMIALIRYCRKNNIPMDSSIVLNRMNAGEA